ncbi:MAG: hypothetical protein IT343_02205 [Candidatus Melainabacteria bacterium]|jgi:hypothetical protein|nr:hypothetical protein [Candidatus Melainabacteria bacterium]
MANTNSLLGELLVDWQLASRQQMESAVAESLNRDLPLGLVLTMLDIVDPETLHSAIAAQSFLRDQLITSEQSSSAMSLVKKKRISFGLAMDLLGIQAASKPRNRLGDYLVESESLPREHIKSRLNLTKQTGLHLGRVLVTLADAHHDLVNHALSLQEKVRIGDIDREEAIDRLYSARRCLEVITHVGHDSITNQSKLGNLLATAGFIEDKDIELALCVSKEQNKQLGESLIELNWVKAQVVYAALEVQKLIRTEKISINQGLEQLRRLRAQVGVSEDVPSTPEPQDERNLTFYYFLKLANVLPSPQDKTAQANIPQDRFESQLEETWQELKATPRSPRLPEDVRDLLLQCGFLSEEQQIMVQRAGRTYKLFRERQLNIEQALIQFHLAQSTSSEPGQWSGTFPSLPIF